MNLLYRSYVPIKTPMTIAETATKPTPLLLKFSKLLTPSLRARLNEWWQLKMLVMNWKPKPKIKPLSIPKLPIKIPMAKMTCTVKLPSLETYVTKVLKKKSMVTEKPIPTKPPGWDRDVWLMAMLLKDVQKQKENPSHDLLRSRRIWRPGFIGK